MQMAIAAPVAHLPHKGMVSDSTFRRVSARIANDYGFSQPEAEAIFDGALGFLKLCVDEKGPFAPSPMVDVGWHTFLLYTPEYLAFCEQHAGYFIHHIPNDGGDSAMGSHGVVRSAKTVGYMVTHGIGFNPEVWEAAPANPDDLPLKITNGGRNPNGCCDGGKGGGGSGWDGKD